MAFSRTGLLAALIAGGLFGTMGASAQPSQPQPSAPRDTAPPAAGGSGTTRPVPDGATTGPGVPNPPPPPHSTTTPGSAPMPGGPPPRDTTAPPSQTTPR